MGGDGGAINTKKGILEGFKALTEQKNTMGDRDKDLLGARSKWRFCAASTKLLWSPILADQLGNLYRKDVVVNELLKRKADQPPTVGVSLPPHLKKMKQFKQLVFDSPALARQGASCSSSNGCEPSNEDEIEDLIQCPLSGAVANGMKPFVCYWECGHVVTVEAVRDLAKATSEVLSAAATTKEQPSSEEVAGGAPVVRSPPLPKFIADLPRRCPCSGCPGGKDTDSLVVPLVPSAEVVAELKALGQGAPAEGDAGTKKKAKKGSSSKRERE